MLREKSLTDLRSIAQGYGITDIFSKDKLQLLQDIELKQQDMQPKPVIDIPKPEYDPRIMSKIPARLSERSYIEQILQPYVDRGMCLTFPEPETWAISLDKRNDTGSMRIPPRVILNCASKVMNG